MQPGDLLWFSFEAEAHALPPEWLAHPKDLIPLAETNTAVRRKEHTAKLKLLEQEVLALETENRLCLKKGDFVRVKELRPLIAAAQQRMLDFKAKAPAPPRSAIKRVS